MGFVAYVQENGTKTRDFISAPEGRLLLSHKILETPPDSVKGDKFRYEYALRDHLGNTPVSCRCGDPKRGEDGKLLTGESAGIDSVLAVQINDYDPWGLSFGSEAESQHPKGITNRFQYNGKEKIADMDLGWSDYGARMYDPSIGRWNVVDPLTESQESWGTYHYVYDNPIKNTDPDGKNPILAALAGAVAGAGMEYLTQVGSNVVKNGGNITMDAFTKNISYSSIAVAAGEGALTMGASVGRKLAIQVGGIIIDNIVNYKVDENGKVEKGIDTDPANVIKNSAIDGVSSLVVGEIIKPVGEEISKGLIKNVVGSEGNGLAKGVKSVLEKSGVDITKKINGVIKESSGQFVKKAPGVIGGSMETATNMFINDRKNEIKDKTNIK